MITSIAYPTTLTLQTPPAQPAPLCTPAVKEQIDQYVAQAEMSNDSGTFAYGMGACVGLMVGMVTGSMSHPAIGVLAGGAVMAGAFYLGRTCDREARASMDKANELNDQYKCY
jgi:hypothetical protein